MPIWPIKAIPFGLHLPFILNPLVCLLKAVLRRASELIGLGRGGGVSGGAPGHYFYGTHRTVLSEGGLSWNIGVLF